MVAGMIGERCPITGSMKGCVNSQQAITDLWVTKFPLTVKLVENAQN